jgi:hypothetical protein
MDLTSQSALIENTMLRIRMESIPALASARDYLETLYERIKDALDREGTISSQPTASIEIGQSIFLFTHVVIDYFGSLKGIRPLTEEENEIGNQLRDLMQQTMDGLIKASK